MGQVTVKVNGREFALACDDGQETRIRRLAQIVDARATEFAAGLGQVGDARLILLAALTLADELAEANEALQRLQSAAAPSAAVPQLAPEPAADAAAKSIRDLAQRIEAVAARHKTP